MIAAISATSTSWKYEDLENKYGSILNRYNLIKSDRVIDGSEITIDNLVELLELSRELQDVFNSGGELIIRTVAKNEGYPDYIDFIIEIYDDYRE